MRSFFSCLLRSICLMATELLVPTRYAVKVPPHALFQKWMISADDSIEC
jgi:hypothetical protein